MDIKANDIVKFNFRGESIIGVVKWTYKTIAKVRVLKNGKKLWHEYIKIKDLVKLEEEKNE